MVKDIITGEENLDNVRKMFYREISEFQEEQKRLDKIIKNRLRLIEKTKKEGKYVQIIKSNIR